MSAMSKQIPIKVRIENALYYELKQYVEIHFSNRNKIINEAIRRFILEATKKTR